MTWLSVPLMIVVLPGTATSFIVGFKNVQTCNRAMDALAVWTGIVGASRSRCSAAGPHRERRVHHGTRNLSSFGTGSRETDADPDVDVDAEARAGAAFTEPDASSASCR